MSSCLTSCAFLFSLVFVREPQRLPRQRPGKQQGRLDLISVGRRPLPQGLQTSTKGEDGTIFLQNPDKMQASKRPKKPRTRQKVKPEMKGPGSTSQDHIKAYTLHKTHHPNHATSIPGETAFPPVKWNMTPPQT